MKNLACRTIWNTWYVELGSFVCRLKATLFPFTSPEFGYFVPVVFIDPCLLTIPANIECYKSAFEAPKIFPTLV